MDNESKIKELEDELKNVNDELQRTKDHLKKYTAPASRKLYYENNKEKEKQRVKDYNKRTNYKNPCKATPEQRKITNRRDYLKRKEKLKNDAVENPNVVT